MLTGIQSMRAAPWSGNIWQPISFGHSSGRGPARLSCCRTLENPTHFGILCWLTGSIELQLESVSAGRECCTCGARMPGLIYAGGLGGQWAAVTLTTGPADVPIHGVCNSSWTPCSPRPSAWPAGSQSAKTEVALVAMVGATCNATGM